MSRKIEALLRIVSEMQYLDESKDTILKRTTNFNSEELSESELDLVAAAAITPIFPDREDTSN